MSTGVLLFLGAAVAAAQDTFPPGTFLDERAEELFIQARERWVEVDRSILSYDAVSRMRMGAYLRTFLRDRTLIEAEAASRVHWSADSTAVIQALGSTGRTLAGPLDVGSIPPASVALFDPTSDRISFGLDLFADDMVSEGDEDDVGFTIEHPIAPGAEEHYRYQTGDSLTLTLPDGRTVRSIALELVPRQRSGRLVSGEVWIEPESGALVRALYRLSTQFDLETELSDDADVDFGLVPGMFLPMEFDVSMVVIEYTLWDFRHWMPSRWRLEGYVRAGAVRVPFQLDQSYQILDVVAADSGVDPEPPEDVVERWLSDGRYGDRFLAFGPDQITNETNPYESPDEVDEAPGDGDDGDAQPADGVVQAQDGDAQGRSGDDEPSDGDAEEDALEVHLIVPEDPEDLRTSPLLPPPVGRDAPGFTSRDELDEFLRELASLPVPDRQRTRFGFDTGPELGELTRYNRVEGFAVGARASWTTLTGIGPVGGDLRGWIGIGTGEPDVRMRLYRESPFHRLTFSAYHRVDEVEPLDGNLGIGNSMGALLWGSDSGEYFRATGAGLRWEPMGVRRPWYHVTVSAEEHRALPKAVDFTIAGLLGGDDDPFRPGLEAGEGREYAAAVALDPWWGTNPLGVQGGISLLLQGAGGDYEWFRSRIVGRLSTPLFSGLRTGLEFGAGRVWGEPPLQRHWYLGGSRTLRGYRGSSVVGTDMIRSRVELSSQTAGARLSLFSDAAWAGPRGAFDAEDALISAGVGISLLDGLFRMDLARALRTPTGWRVELQVDAFF